MFLDQIELPDSLPALDVRFAADCINVEGVLFKIDQTSDIIFFDKNRTNALTMLLHPFQQVGSYAGIQRPIASACKNVDKA